MNTHDSTTTAPPSCCRATLAEEAAAVETGARRAAGRSSGVRRQTDARRGAAGCWARSGLRPRHRGRDHRHRAGRRQRRRRRDDRRSRSSTSRSAGGLTRGRRRRDYFGAQPGNPEGPGPGDPTDFAAAVHRAAHAEPTAELAGRAGGARVLDGRPDRPRLLDRVADGVEVDGSHRRRRRHHHRADRRRPTWRPRATSTAGAGATRRSRRCCAPRARAGDASFTYNGEPLDHALRHRRRRALRRR